jgi:hypothetical protein
MFIASYLRLVHEAAGKEQIRSGDKGETPSAPLFVRPRGRVLSLEVKPSLSRIQRRESQAVAKSRS